MKFSTQTKVAVMLLSASVLSFTPGCTDAEIAGTIGAIAIGAGIAAGAGHNHGHGHYRCLGGFRDVCHQYVDYYGHLRTECRTEYDSCAEREWCPDKAEIEMDLQTSDSKEKLSATEFAKIFEMSFESAESLISAFEMARDGDLKAILDLGLTREDVELLMKAVMPTDAGIEALAKSLDQSVESARALVEQILKFGRENRATIEDFRDRH